MNTSGELLAHTWNKKTQVPFGDPILIDLLVFQDAFQSNLPWPFIVFNVYVFSMSCQSANQPASQLAGQSASQSNHQQTLTSN